MSCIEVMHRLAEYLQGSLDNSETVTIRRHVDHCPCCRLVVRSASETLRIHFAADEEIHPVESHAV